MTIYEIQENKAKTICITKEDEIILKKIQTDKRFKLEKTELCKDGKIKYKIQVKHHIGYIKLFDTEVHVHSKIKGNFVFFMISKTLDPSFKWINHEFASLDDESIEELHIVEIFIHAIDSFIERELRKDYIPKTEILKFQRGKINVEKNILLPIWKRQNLVCDYDEFTYDNEPNRIIKYATWELVQTARKTKKNFVKLEEILRRLSRINLEKTSIERISYLRENLSKQFEHYSQILSICELILSHLSFSTLHGNYKINSFIMNMFILYENYVFAITKAFFEKENSNYCVDKSRLLPLEGKYDAKPEKITYKPDIVLYENDNQIPKMVGDAKYRDLDKILYSNSKNLNANIYQIASYMTFTKAKRGVLFYPGSETGGIIQEFTFNENSKILLVCLPLQKGKDDSWSAVMDKNEEILAEVLQRL